jgi:hypothetical protein
MVRYAWLVALREELSTTHLCSLFIKGSIKSCSFCYRIDELQCLVQSCEVLTFAGYTVYNRAGAASACVCCLVALTGNWVLWFTHLMHGA